MNRFLEMNQDQIRKAYPFDVWIGEEEAKSMKFFQWCADCLIEGKYLESQVTYRGSSLCLNHFKLKVKENDID